MNCNCPILIDIKSEFLEPLLSAWDSLPEVSFLVLSLAWKKHKYSGKYLQQILHTQALSPAVMYVLSSNFDGSNIAVHVSLSCYMNCFSNSLFLSISLYYQTKLS